MARRPNYGAEKRQKELAKQQKREEKAEKKRQRKEEEETGAPTGDGELEPAGADPALDPNAPDGE